MQTPPATASGLFDPIDGAVPVEDETGPGRDAGTDEDKQVRDQFHVAVNMTGGELADFLDTDESKSVGQKTDGSGESTGHASGRRIVELLHTKVADLTDDDHDHMQKVVGYIARHVEQGPSKGDVEDSRWRYSLMNWGHDPLKD